MSNQIYKMVEQFKSIEELKAYSIAQYETIKDLSTKLAKSDSENKDLKDRLNKLQIAGITEQSDSDEMLVCKLEIAKLREFSTYQELNMEQAKRFDIYVKTLNSLREIKKPEKNPAEDASIGDLLSLVKSE